jgi:hypothetical protein
MFFSSRKEIIFSGIFNSSGDIKTNSISSNNQSKNTRE